MLFNCHFRPLQATSRHWFDKALGIAATDHLRVEQQALRTRRLLQKTPWCRTSVRSPPLPRRATQPYRDPCSMGLSTRDLLLVRTLLSWSRSVILTQFYRKRWEGCDLTFDMLTDQVVWVRAQHHREAAPRTELAARRTQRPRHRAQQHGRVAQEAVGELGERSTNHSGAWRKSGASREWVRTNDVSHVHITHTLIVTSYFSDEIQSKNDDIRSLTSKLRVAESEIAQRSTALSHTQDQLASLSEQQSEQLIRVDELHVSRHLFYRNCMHRFCATLTQQLFTT